MSLAILEYSMFHKKIIEHLKLAKEEIDMTIK